VQRSAARASLLRVHRVADARCAPTQATPLVAGLSVAAAALTARSALQYYQVWKVAPRLRKFYEGGFQEKMDESEALKILNLRCAVAQAKWRPNARLRCAEPAAPPPATQQPASERGGPREGGAPQNYDGQPRRVRTTRRFALAACRRPLALHRLQPLAAACARAHACTAC
jgi:hypothetical protein